MTRLAHPCALCGAPRASNRRDRRGRCCVGIHEPAGALVSHVSEYEDDPAARLFVETFADGASAATVGLALGISRQRVQQIEAAACRRLATTASKLFGWGPHDLAEALAARRPGHVMPSTVETGHRGTGRDPATALDLRSEHALAVAAEIDRVERRLAAVLEVLALAADIDAAEKKGRAA